MSYYGRLLGVLNNAVVKDVYCRKYSRLKR
nr:MAG TPA: hypothetical protein [Caudoviricetes sp.]